MVVNIIVLYNTKTIAGGLLIKTVHFLEYSLSRQVLYRNLVRRRDSISLGEQERCLIDYMSRKNHQNNQSVICEYDELIQAIWHNDIFKRDRKTINHLVWRIRDKIELDSGEPQFLKTVKGRGYLLDRDILPQFTEGFPISRLRVYYPTPLV